MLHMDKNTKVKLIVGGATSLVLAVALGASAAIAASRSLSSNDGENVVVADAATELGVEPDTLATALKQAFKNRVEEALEADRLTEEQAREPEERIDSVEAPFRGGFGHRRGFGHLHGLGHRGGLGHVGRPGGIDVAASYLGLSRDQLREELRDGTTLAEIAKGEGKSVSGLVQAMVDDASKRLDEAISAGRLTKEQADEIRKGLEERLTELVNGELRLRPFFGHPGFGQGLRLPSPSVGGSARLARRYSHHPNGGSFPVWGEYLVRGIVSLESVIFM